MKIDIQRLAIAAERERQRRREHWARLLRLAQAEEIIDLIRR